MKAFFLLLILLLPANLVFAQTWQETYQKADSMMQKRDFKNSIPIYEVALELAEKEFGEKSEQFLMTRNGLGRSVTFVKGKEEIEPFLSENVELCKKYGEKTPVYAQSLHNIAVFYLPQQIGNNPTKSEDYFKQAYSLRKEILSSKHTDYESTLNGFALLYIRVGNYKAAIPLQEELVQIRKENKSPNHPDYASAINDLAILYQMTNNFSQSELLHKECLKIRKDVLGTMNTDYANSLSNLADLYMKTNNLAAAQPLYEQCLMIRKTILGNKHPEYADALKKLADLHQIMNNYHIAEPFYKECLKVQKEALGKKHSSYISSLNNLARLYQEFNDYLKAEEHYIECLNIKNDVLGKAHPSYAISLTNLGNLYRELGNFTKAELLLKEAMVVQKNYYGVDSPAFVAALSGEGNVYFTMGDYLRAENCYKECINILKRTGSTNLPAYAGNLNNLAVLYLETTRYTEAEKLLIEAIELRKQQNGENSILYAHSLITLADLCFKSNQLKKATVLYEQCLAIYDDIYKENKEKSALILNSLAYLLLITKQHNLAKSLFEKSIKLQKRTSNDKHPNLMTYKAGLAVLLWLQNDKQSAFRESNEIKNIGLKISDLNFSVLSEYQRENFYYHKLQPHFNAFAAYALQMLNIPSMELYDLQLTTKAMLMLSSQKMKSRILSSGDTALIQKYEVWNILKGQIIKADEMGEIVKQTTLDSLTQVCENLEKELSQKSQAFASLTDKKQVTWQNIQKALKKDEAAIEIVRIKKFGVQKIVADTSDVEKAPNFPKYSIYGLTDTVYYAALIVKKKSKQPEIVLLKNGNDLEKKFVNYQKNAILYKREDAISYNEFWKPIAEKLKGIKKVYFSPDGVYNQISLNTLQNPETKKYVLDEIELHLVTNTKDILTFGKAENKNFKAELLGYPIYDLQTENANESRKRELASDSTRAFNNFQKVSLLPGTKKEVEDISQILKTENYELEILLEKNATEENIKKVRNPKILHISTHGFFIDSKEKNEKINPMLRSGLLLTGVSDYTRAEIKPDTEDGVLTALEAANLDLDETDLVVLSACETGLGDVKAGEGVYGLQRAFKVAGAKTIVMSMWKVDDAVTQKLMTTFYQKFAEYNNARKAFKEAQLEIKKQYPEPFYWGAFVMTGE